MKTHVEFDEAIEKRPHWLEIVRRHVESLRFGIIQIAVHDSQVTQIDKTERVRLERPKIN